MKNLQAIIFDMDGVLIDSKNCMAHCWQEVRNTLHLEQPFEDYFSLIGVPFRDILDELKIDRTLWNVCEEIYFSAQLNLNHLIVEYPGTSQVLATLHERGYTLGLVTSKNSKSVHNILRKNNWNNFACVVTPESCHLGKPNPDPLLYFTGRTGIDPRACVYIGDALVDKACADSAGVEFIHARWGYQQFPSPNAIENIQSLLAYADTNPL